MKKSIFTAILAAFALSACMHHARLDVHTTSVEVDVHHGHHHHHHR